MPALLDLASQRFGRLVVLFRVEDAVFGDRRVVQWHCQCDCGKSTRTTTILLRSGHKRSCGCLQRENGQRRATHGHSRNFKASKLYRVWRAMIDRCHNPNLKGFQGYGSRGITVCDRWRNSFTNFLSDMGEPAEGQSIDRVDNDGPYSPENCRWATSFEQALNKRTTRRLLVAGRAMSLEEAAKQIGMKRWTLRRRLNAGLTVPGVSEIS